MADQFGRLCRNGNLEGVQAALHSGVDVNTTDVAGLPGLFYAVECNHTAVARILLAQEGIDVNLVNDWGSTALHWAASDEKNSEIVALLITHPDLRTINQRDADGCTPLFWAVENNAVKCIGLLLSDPRTDPNIKSIMMGVPPLMRAVWDDHPDCVQLLMENARTDPNMGDGVLSPLMWAVKLNQVQCVELLLPDPRLDLSERDNFKRSGEEAAR